MPDKTSIYRRKTVKFKQYASLAAAHAQVGTPL